MKNADSPAMPQVVTEDSRGNGLVGSHMKEEWQGITKREIVFVGWGMVLIWAKENTSETHQTGRDAGVKQE